MPKSGALLAVCFVAGLLAAVVSALFIWSCNRWGITGLLEVKIGQSLNLSAFTPKCFSVDSGDSLTFSPSASLVTGATGSVKGCGFPGSRHCSRFSISIPISTIKASPHWIWVCLPRCSLFSQI